MKVSGQVCWYVFGYCFAVELYLGRFVAPHMPHFGLRLTWQVFCELSILVLVSPKPLKDPLKEGCQNHVNLKPHPSTPPLPHKQMHAHNIKNRNPKIQQGLVLVSSLTKVRIPPSSSLCPSTNFFADPNPFGLAGGGTFFEGL